MLLNNVKLCLHGILPIHHEKKSDFYYVLKILITWFVRYLLTTHLVK